VNYDIKIVHQYDVDILILIDFFTQKCRKSRWGLAAPQSAHSSYLCHGWRWSCFQKL